MSVAAALEERYGGVHVASGLHDQVEGDELGPVTSILQFPSLEAAQAFWNDPEYQRVAPLRRAGLESQVLIIEGAEVPAPFAKSPPRAELSERRWSGVRGRDLGRRQVRATRRCRTLDVGAIPAIGGQHCWLRFVAAARGDGFAVLRPAATGASPRRRTPGQLLLLSVRDI